MIEKKDEAIITKDSQFDASKDKDDITEQLVVKRKKGPIKGSKKCCCCKKMTPPDKLVKMGERYYCIDCSKKDEVISKEKQTEEENQKKKEKNKKTSLKNSQGTSSKGSKTTEKKKKAVIKEPKETKIECCECGKFFFPADIVKIESKNYCKKCSKKKNEKKDVKREKEIQYNKEINDVLYKLCNYNKDMMPYLGRQISKIKRDNGWRSESILYTLRYIFEDSEDPPVFDPDYGIAWLIEKNYVNAKKYYTKFFQLRKKPEEEIMHILTMKPKEICLKRSEIIKQEQKFSERRRNLIYGPELNMDDIEDDSEYYKEGKDT